eukprot:GFKZ01008111.1.p1 GENE.GFKZ01008111.1~~GFKZ01008111.1.p1  ORF type:complete len:361 (-),score=24.06 GFKZ01008111.1:2032-3009(-)
MASELVSFASISHAMADSSQQPIRRSSEPASSPPSSEKSVFPSFLHLRSRRSELPPNPPAEPTDPQWYDLIVDFESRAPPRVPNPPTTPPSSPALTTATRNVECSFMIALTTVIWYFGRVFRLDAFLLLFYPLPTMYISSKWGPYYANLTLISTLVFIFLIVGPIYAQLFFLNSGLLILAYSYTLHLNWTFLPVLLAGAAAKAIGLFLNVKWVSFILKHNSWKYLTEQTRALLISISNFINWITRSSALSAPSLSAIQIGIVTIITLHSLYHVFCTLLVTSLFLRKLSQQGRLKKVPPQVPGMEWLIKRSQAAQGPKQSTSAPPD